MISINDLNHGDRPHPSAPVERELRAVITDLRDGVIDTNLRYGRKQQWKSGQQQRYIIALLEGKVRTDPVAISRRPGIVVGSDRAVNGNNRFRTKRAFVDNGFGVEMRSSDPDDHRLHTYYYDTIPAFETGNPRRRNLVHVLPTSVRLKFDRYPILFTIREGLSEREEIAWYEELNTNTVVHSEGHLLKARICNSEDPFVNPFLATFPVIKSSINEPIVDADVESLGSFLTEIAGYQPELMDERDKKEHALLSLAIIYNLLVNGMPYDGKFHGEFSNDNLVRNVQKMRDILTRALCSEEFKTEWASPVNRKPFQTRFWSARYLLGAMAWSIATNQPGVADIWVNFLGLCRAGTVDARCLVPLAQKSGRSDDKAITYADYWGLVIAAI